MKRVLTIQDLSCFGKCSTTIALPVLSAAGVEACPLPLLLLSSHTAYDDPARLDTAGFAAQTTARWKQESIHFDAIHIGYLGGIRQLRVAVEILRGLKQADTRVILDPAMADNGRLYSGLPPDFADAVKNLCAGADLLLPNVSEAALLLGRPYPGDALDADIAAEWAALLLEQLGAKAVVLTGIGDGPGRTGAWYADADGAGHSAGPKVPGDYHGAGDLFAAVMTASAVQGLPLASCVELAVSFTHDAVACTAQTGRDGRQGLIFEPLLPQLAKRIAGI